MDTIIFVYNVDSGFFNTLKDALHKSFSPATYPCKLCELSHGVLTMKKPWRNYLQQLPFQKKFLHRNEFREQYPDCRDAELPAIFLQIKSACTELVPAQDINQQKNLTDLIELVDNRLKNLRSNES